MEITEKKGLVPSAPLPPFPLVQSKNGEWENSTGGWHRLDQLGRVGLHLRCRRSSPRTWERGWHASAHALAERVSDLNMVSSVQNGSGRRVLIGLNRREYGWHLLGVGGNMDGTCWVRRGASRAPILPILNWTRNLRFCYSAAVRPPCDRSFRRFRPTRLNDQLDRREESTSSTNPRIHGPNVPRPKCSTVQQFDGSVRLSNCLTRSSHLRLPA